MISFFAVGFAIAGAIAATGPIIIHLLNRRRFRVVQWAAMDFLREALQRNRRILELRDLLLLALRTACVLLFGLAMARPFITRLSAGGVWAYLGIALAILAAIGLTVAAKALNNEGHRKLAGTAAVVLGLLSLLGIYQVTRAGNAETAEAINSGEPIHAVMVIDNSLSMGYERDGVGTNLDAAKEKATEFIKRLPAGSHVSILPLCGATTEYSRDASRSQEDALETLANIQVVDRIGTASQAIDLAGEACQRSPELPTKRVVFIGDQQLANWPSEGLGPRLEELPDMQVVQVVGGRENTWVSDFRLQDGIADVETHTAFWVTVRHEGSRPRPAVQISLKVDGSVVASKSIDLEPGQSREVEFPYQFDALAEPGRPAFVIASAGVQQADGDELPLDNERHLVVPVVAALPVLFVDDLGRDEDPSRNQYGQTLRLRRLLAPITSRDGMTRHLVKIVHRKLEDLDQETLRTARLVVVAGVERPDSGSVDLLREYVKQGGQLVLAAGGRFSPADWSQVAWQDGNGILPLPLKPEPVGQLPSEATSELRPFQLDPQTMIHDYFLIADENWQELYRGPYFFKAVEVDTGDDVLKKLVAVQTQQIEEDRKFLSGSRGRSQKFSELEAKGQLSESERSIRREDETKLKALNPDWLAWSPELLDDSDRLSAADLALRTRPQVLATFDNKLPFAVERRIGRGHVLFFSSGVFSEWNTLPRTNAVLLFDRVFRSMLERTLPHRNLESTENILLPVAPEDRRARFSLTRPSDLREPLTVDALGADSYGITVRNVAQRGIYRVTAYDADSIPKATPVSTSGGQASADDLMGTKLWEIPLAVNGPSEESDLLLADESILHERLGADANFRWVAASESISLEGARVRGQNWWKLVMSLVLIGLIVESVVLAWPKLARERAA